ncbi:MAG: hypothetical protein ACLFVO_04315 [Chloroflexaceae bacterium]
MDHEHHDMSEIRETANAAMYQAILCLAGDIASGRAEEKECTMLPQASRTGYPDKRLVWNRPRNACE